MPNALAEAGYRSEETLIDEGPERDNAHRYNPFGVRLKHLAICGECLRTTPKRT